MKNQTSHQNRQPIRHSTTPPRIFIAIQYLEIGGAERSLIGLLNTLDYSRCQVDLFVYRHSGEFMSLIPKEVNLLPEVKKYTTLTRPIREIICEGYWDIAAGRITFGLALQETDEGERKSGYFSICGKLYYSIPALHQRKLDV